MAVSDEDRPLSTPREHPSSEREAYGPITVRRSRKDDGRTLILYGRAPSKGPDGGAARRGPGEGPGGVAGETSEERQA
jgi:hypothetical protein